MLSAGSTIEVVVPNSGGYGDPFQRDPELVLSDVLDGFTTVELAERDYGVVLDLERRTVDHEATRRLRERRRAGAGSPAR
jgi:N-methylhydantoinase B/oxoprolinase/acetone carboxylase alpha subunit